MLGLSCSTWLQAFEICLHIPGQLFRFGASKESSLNGPIVGIATTDFRSGSPFYKLI